MKERKCPLAKITIPKDRKIIEVDSKDYQWKRDPFGYFLIKIENECICCGFVNGKTHEMNIEFRGNDMEKMIREIARRNICNMETMGYVASELMIARDALDKGKKYIQR